MQQYTEINIPVPDEILLSLRLNGDEFATQMKIITAIKLYESQKLSIGQAAAFAGMSEQDFIRLLGKHQISIFGSISDIAEDYANA
jgi:predicted HTH domain antitoxin